jgi:hypothetical protein
VECFLTMLFIYLLYLSISLRVATLSPETTCTTSEICTYPFSSSLPRPQYHFSRTKTGMHRSLVDLRPSILITLVNIRPIYSVGDSASRGSNSSVKSSVELLGLDTAPIVLLLCRGSSSGWECRLTSLTAPLRSTADLVGASMVSSKIGCTQGLD